MICEVGFCRHHTNIINPLWKHYHDSIVEMMKYQKIIILGIDCLDYHLIRKWALKHYILDSFGYYFVGLNLYTPIIWAKFLTGINVEKHGFSSKRLSVIKRIKSLYYIGYPLILFKKIIDVLSQHNNRRVRKVNETSPFNVRNAFSKFIMLNSYSRLSLNEKIVLKLLIKAAYSERLPKKLLRKTFVNDAMNKGLRVQLIEFPPINDDTYSLIRNMLYFYVNAPPNERQFFLDYVWQATETTLDTLLKSLDDYDLILCYTPYIDVASHMFYKPKNLRRMLKLYSAYKKLGRKIEEVISKVHGGTVVLIVSDHGYSPARQDHSYFGYWSINAQIYKKPRTILDFKHLIRRLIS